MSRLILGSVRRRTYRHGKEVDSLENKNIGKGIDLVGEITGISPTKGMDKTRASIRSKIGIVIWIPGEVDQDLRWAETNVLIDSTDRTKTLKDVKIRRHKISATTGLRTLLGTKSGIQTITTAKAGGNQGLILLNLFTLTDSLVTYCMICGTKELEL